jgi:hypothetical protein
MRNLRMILRRVSDWVRIFQRFNPGDVTLSCGKKSSAPVAVGLFKPAHPEISRVGGSSASYQGSRHGEKGRIATVIFFDIGGASFGLGLTMRSPFLFLFLHSLFILKSFAMTKLTPPHLYQ